MCARALVLALSLALAAVLALPSTATGQEPVGQWSTGTKGTDDFPSLGSFAPLVDVRTASHPGGEDHPPFDRVVLEFEGGDPSWRVTYVEPPIEDDGTGEQIDIEGAALLELRLYPASGVDISGAEPRQTYDGPTRIELDGHAALEIVRRGDFEANLAWVIGVSHEAPFAASFLSDPPRLVVDVVDERDFDVARYQSNLNLWFRFVTPEDRGRLIVDGEFDSATRAATREFQRGQRLPVTGEADGRTRTTLDGVLTRLIATPFAQRELEWPLRIPGWFWPWARWYLGHAEFAGEARNPALRPAAAPRPIPDWAWRRLGPFLDRDEEARAQLLVRQRIAEVFAPVDEISTTLRSERDPYWILVTGSHEGPQGSFAAWLRMREGRWVPWRRARSGLGAHAAACRRCLLRGTRSCPRRGRRGHDRRGTP